MRKHFKLDKWQIDIKNEIIKNKNAAIFVEQRLGKTLAAIEGIEAKPNIQTVVIVTPANAFDDWYNELNGIASAVIIKGTKPQRVKLLNNNTAKYILVNYECYQSLAHEFNNIKQDVLLLDESHKIKEPKTKRTKFFMRLKVKTKHRIIMTGTPNPENETDYFSQLYFLDPKILGYDNFYVWRLHNFMPAFHNWKIKPKYLKEFNDIINNNCLTISRREHNVDPVVKTKLIFVDLNEKLIDAYENTEMLYILKYKDTTKKTNYSIGATIWQQQIAAGYINNKLVSRHKIKALLKTLKGIKSKKPVIIWACFRNELASIYKVLKKDYATALVHGDIKADEQTDIYNRFKAGKIKYLVVNPTVWQTSKNLSVAYGAVYYSIPRSNVVYQQSKDRPINVRDLRTQRRYYILTSNTIDVDIYEKMHNKSIKVSFSKYMLRQAKKRQQQNAKSKR